MAILLPTGRRAIHPHLDRKANIIRASTVNIHPLVSRTKGMRPLHTAEEDHRRIVETTMVSLPTAGIRDQVPRTTVIHRLQHRGLVADILRVYNGPRTVVVVEETHHRPSQVHSRSFHQQNDRHPQTLARMIILSVRPKICKWRTRNQSKKQQKKKIQRKYRRRAEIAQSPRNPKNQGSLASHSSPRQLRRRLQSRYPT